MRRWTYAGAILSTLLWGCSQSGGSADRPTMSAVEIVGPGEQCPDGGQKILTGVDTNGNGVLEANEVTQVAYVCNGESAPPCTTLEGSVTIRNALDWADLTAEGCTRITGTLEIAAAGLPSLATPSPLVEVGTLLVHDNDVLSGVAFPSLERITGDLEVTANASLTTLELPSLRRVEGAIRITDGGPSAVGFPVLEEVGGDLELHSTPVGRLALPRLVRTGGLSVTGVANLTELSLPALATAGSVSMWFADALTSFDVPVLGTVTGFVAILDNASLAAIRMPALTALGVDPASGGGRSSEIARNPSLAAIELPALTTLGAFEIDAAAVTTLDLHALTEVGHVGIQAAVTTLDLRRLTTVRDGLTIRTPLVRAFELPVLTTAGGLSITGAALESLDLPVLTTVGPGGFGLTVAVLDALELPALTAVGGGLSVGSTARRDNPQTPQDESGTPSVLQRISLPLLASVAFDLSVTRSPALVELDAPVLESAGGLGIIETALPRVSFPALTSLTATLMYTSIGFGSTYSSGAVNLAKNGALVAVNLPVLARASHVTITQDAALTALELPMLTSAGGFEVGDVAALTTISAPQLVRAMQLSVTSAPALTHVELPSFATDGATVTFRDNAALPSVSLPAFTVGSTIYFQNNASLTTISLPSLARLFSWVFVTSNPALETLSLPALGSIGSGLSVHDNPSLAQCQVDALQAQLGQVFAPGFLLVYGNDTSATCP